MKNASLSQNGSDCRCVCAYVYACVCASVLEFIFIFRSFIITNHYYDLVFCVSFWSVCRLASENCVYLCKIKYGSMSLITVYFTLLARMKNRREKKVCVYVLMKSLRVGIKNEMEIWRKNAVYNLRFLRLAFEQMFIFPLLYDSLFPIHFHRFCSRICLLCFIYSTGRPISVIFIIFRAFPFSARTAVHVVNFPCSLFVSFTVWVCCRCCCYCRRCSWCNFYSHFI